MNGRQNHPFTLKGPYVNWPSKIEVEPNGEALEISLTSDLAKAIEGAQKRISSASEAFESKNYAEAVRLQEGITAALRHAESVADGKPGYGTLNALVGLSWYQLFAGQYDAAIAAADRTAVISKDLISDDTSRTRALMVIDTNRAYALMLKGSIGLGVLEPQRLGIPALGLHSAHGAKAFVVPPKRWIVERTIAWLNRCRRLAKVAGGISGSDTKSLTGRFLNPRNLL